MREKQRYLVKIRSVDLCQSCIHEHIRLVCIRNATRSARDEYSNVNTSTTLRGHDRRLCGCGDEAILKVHHAMFLENFIKVR
jgi:hypothetical protein